MELEEIEKVEVTRQERREYRHIIESTLPVTELLAGGAEEATELAQALLKMRRVLTGTNPTTKTFDEVQDNIFEEIADLKLYLEAIGYYVTSKEVKAWEDYKIQRWAKRLKSNIGQAGQPRQGSDSRAKIERYGGDKG